VDVDIVSLTKSSIKSVIINGSVLIARIVELSIKAAVNKYSPDGREMLNASRFIDSSDILKLLVNSEMFFV